MNLEVLSQYDVLSVAEGAGTTFEDAHALVDADRKELNMAYHFEGIDIGRATGEYELKEFKELYSRWDSAFANDGWLAIFLANHDNARMVSRFGNDSPEYRELSSKMLTTFIMTMRGTPFYYYGDELGMTNINFENIEDYQDIDTRNRYKKLVADGGDVKAFLEREKLLARDNGRTPFQWDDSQNAGFSTSNPWLKVNPNYKTINVAAQEDDPQSVLNYFRRLTQLRKDNPVLIYGQYTLLDKGNDSVYSYLREGEGDRLLVMLNFTSSQAEANLDIDVMDAELVSSNYPNGKSNTTLRPYEARIIRLP